MNFAFSHDQKVLRDQARKFLAEHASSTRVRRVLDTDMPHDRELWQGMGEMGWMGTAVPEQYGGAGYGHLELCVIAEELGRSLAPTPFSSSVYLATEAILLAGSEAQKKRWLPKLAMGEGIGCFALAEGPITPTPASLATTARSGRLSGVKLPVADGDVASVAVVAARTSGGAGDRSLSLFLVDLGGPDVKRTTVKTIDPTRSHARIVFDEAHGELLGG